MAEETKKPERKGDEKKPERKGDENVVFIGSKPFKA